jgi:4-carboxymuconolactone decarboxylase
MTTAPRITRFTPDLLDEGAKHLYDTLVQGPRGPRILQPDGSLSEPFNVLLLSPRAGDRMQALGLAVQRETTLPAAAREAVILTVVHSRGCRPEWEAHSPSALDAGVTEADLDAIAAGGALPDADDVTCAATALAAGLLERRGPDAAEYPAAIESLGERRVLEVCLLVGYYEALCNLFTVFGLDG